MNEATNRVWVAGAIEGCGQLLVTVEQGPTRMYHALTLVVMLGEPGQYTRLMIAGANGVILGTPQRFEITGYAAVRGFIEELWPYFTPEYRAYLNTELRRFKLYRAEDKKGPEQITPV